MAQPLNNTTPATATAGTALVTAIPQDSYALTTSSEVFGQDGASSVTKKGEIGYAKRNDDDAIIKPMARGKAWPAVFENIAAFNEAAAELMEFRRFKLATSFSHDLTDAQEAASGPVQWNFGAAKNAGAPGVIYAIEVPTLENVIDDKSLLGAIIPDGITTNIRQLMGKVNTLLKSDKAHMLKGIDLSPSRVLLALSRLSKSQRGEKARFAYANMCWQLAVLMFRQAAESRAKTPQAKATATAIANELAMASQSPELCYRLVSTFDGIDKQFADLPVPVRNSFNEMIKRWLKGNAEKEADETGKITYYIPGEGEKKKNPLKLSKQDAKFISDQRAATSFMTDTVAMSDEELAALFADPLTIELSTEAVEDTTGNAEAVTDQTSANADADNAGDTPPAS